MVGFHVMVRFNYNDNKYFLPEIVQVMKGTSNIEDISESVKIEHMSSVSNIFKIKFKLCFFQ